ncbi:MAG: SbcC/MukB-like Walker B domain-containing protein, partial [Acidobacteriota bacterium]|nr:SbcC/MukB-like Walker B domain-containing protein [Acidobacteriota bacterium]
EWRSGITARLKSAVEELIGPEVLGTFMVADDRADEAKHVVFKQYPGQRLTHPSLGTDHFPEWFRTTFDMKQSHPEVLRCLAAEMAADREPNIAVFSDRQLLSFRGHERRLRGKPARLIGADGRKKALDREIKALNKALKEQVARRTDLEKRREDLARRTEHIRKLIAFLDKAGSTYRATVAKISNLNLTAEHLQGALAGADERFERLSADLAGLEQRLETMRTIISKEGLANLEGRIARTQKKLNKNGERLQEIMEARGAMKRDIHLIENSIKDLEAERSAQRKLLRTLTARLREVRENLGDPERYVLDDWKGRRFKTAEDIVQARQRNGDRVIEARTLLRARMNEPSLGASFAFVYEEEKNQLLDRRSRTIDELQDFQHKTIEDQRQVINDKTFHLFKEIIMRELVNELRKMVFELEDMKNKINKLLEKRTFGKSRYRFSLKPKKQYRHLIDIIAGMDLVRSEPEKELRAFFDDHKQEIINTEAGEIPDLLDYRNWYQFEMQVTITDEDGAEKERIAMTRKVKSIGSGGEQAVPNYLLVLTIAHFLYGGSKVRLKILLFDEAFYGIDAGRRDQLLGFAGDLGLQLFVASPDQDGVKREIDHSTTVLIVKDAVYDVHTYKFDWSNPNVPKQHDLFEEREEAAAVEFGEELTP